MPITYGKNAIVMKMSNMTAVSTGIPVKMVAYTCPPRVQNWVGMSPQDPNLCWLDQNMCPISDSS